MKLNDQKCLMATPKDKPFKLSDGEGLFLFVATSGSKYWRHKYSKQPSQIDLFAIILRASIEKPSAIPRPYIW